MRSKRHSSAVVVSDNDSDALPTLFELVDTSVVPLLISKARAPSRNHYRSVSRSTAGFAWMTSSAKTLQSKRNDDDVGVGVDVASSSPSTSSSSPPRRRAAFSPCASLTLSNNRGNYSTKNRIEVLNLGFEPGGTNGRKGSSRNDKARKTPQKQQQQRHHIQLRYGWDGSKIVSIDEGDEEVEEERRREKEGDESNDKGRSFPVRRTFSSAARSAERCLDSLARSFFPDPSSVSPDYWSYCRWRAAHRLCSSMLTNFATQALLAAVGVGASRSLPAAAGINWLLKDGLGRVGRLGVATRFGEAFDADIKRFRFATSVLFTASVGLELATPAFPSQFLALAAAANVGKAVGLTTYISTQPSFGASFARGGQNLADVTAKAQAQQMVVDTAGLALCVLTLRGVGKRATAAGAKAAAAAAAAGAASMAAGAGGAAAAGGEAAAAAAAATAAARTAASAAFRRSFGGGVPVPLLALLAAGDLFCIAKELKAVHLRTLNRERAEIAAEAWLRGRRSAEATTASTATATSSTATATTRAPSPETVAELEPLLFPFSPGKGLLPLRFSRLDEAGVSRREDVDAALRRCSKSKDKFLLVRIPSEKKKKKKSSSSSLRLVLRSDAKAEDALFGVLAAAHARAELLVEAEKKAGEKKKEKKDDDVDEEDQLLSRATAAARKDARAFREALEEVGWQVEPFLLSPRERGGLVVLG